VNIAEKQSVASYHCGNVHINNSAEMSRGQI